MMELTGYTDRYSGSPGDTIRFYVNSENSLPYRADMVRLIHGDTNPDGPGFKEEVLEGPVSGEYKGRNQVIHGGSYVVMPDAAPLRVESFTLQTFVWSTTPEKGVQGLVTKWLDSDRSGYGLFIGEDGSLELRIGDGSGRVERVSSGKPLLRKVWYVAAASYDAPSGTVTLYQGPVLWLRTAASA